MPRHQPTEDFNTTYAAQSSTPIDVAHDVQQSQKIPQDPSTLHDFGGMTRLTASDVQVSRIIVKWNFSFSHLWHDYKAYC
jgi:transcription factor E2F3